MMLLLLILRSKKAMNIFQRSTNQRLLLELYGLSITSDEMRSRVLTNYASIYY